MGFFNIFKRKKKKDDDLFSEFEKLKKERLPKEIPAARSKEVSQQVQTSGTDISNLRVKLDLILTEMDSIKTQNQTINERLKAIEKALVDMKGIKYY